MREPAYLRYKLLCAVLCLALCVGMTPALADGDGADFPATYPPEPSAVTTEVPEAEPSAAPEPTAEPSAIPEPTAEPSAVPEPTAEPSAIPEPTATTAPAQETAPANEYWDDPLFYRSTGAVRIAAAAGTDPFAAYTPRALREGEALHKGIDVSTFQKTVDWKAVAAGGIEFAIIRVGYRGSVTGALAPDSYGIKNLIDAYNAGLKVGAYFFSQATTVEEAREEAAYLLDAVKGRHIDLPLVFDYEETVNADRRLKMSELDRQLMTDICNAFCDAVEAAGYDSMVYSNPNTLNKHLFREQLGRLWLAHYTAQTTYAGDYEYWQCGAGPVSGVAGDVDLDFWFEPNGTPVPPGGGTAVTPSAAPSASPVPETPDNPFADVDSGKWFYDSVLWAYGNEIVNGMGPTTFSPNAVATRGQMVTMLYRMSGEPEASVAAPFTDLKEEYYRAAVNWAAEKGIVGGYTATIFAPNNKITREQLAAMLYRMAGSPEITGTLDGFTDGGAVQDYAKSAMVWAVEKGIITGYPDGQIRPGASATRAEVCTMLMRYSDL